MKTILCKDLTALSPQEIDKEALYFFYGQNGPKDFRCAKVLTDPTQLSGVSSELDFLDQTKEKTPLLGPPLADLIASQRLISLNPYYKNVHETLFAMYHHFQSPLKIHIAALGDVGSTLLLGLKLLLPAERVDYIGILDRNQSKAQRFEMEMNQIGTAQDKAMPQVRIIPPERALDCDIFLFCASAFVPSVGDKTKDVRLCQLDKNTEILLPYIEMADAQKFKGLFVIVSDPVDLLCQRAKNHSTQLLPDQILGLGLGVMYQRARYYAQKEPFFSDFLFDGRAFGPHGQDLFIANSLSNFDWEKSLSLTQKTVTANLALRQLGFKPYIAPAISSAALSVLAIIQGDFHYSAQYLDGVYFGCKNRYPHFPFVLFEQNPLPEMLKNQLFQIVKRLGE